MGERILLLQGGESNVTCDNFHVTKRHDKCIIVNQLFDRLWLC
jgi:hypothetical protein